jgi:alpha-beta hydrolase superfamily lysophospholipase
MRLGAAAAAVLLLPLATAAAPRTEPFTLRGQQQTLHIYGAPGGPVAVVASGDGGWTHLAPDVANLLAGRGWLVVGLDSKAYLSSFTSGAVTLRAEDVPRDFAALLDHAAPGAGRTTLLVGVSEGAGLSVLAAADDAVKARISGVIVLGLPDKNELGWRLRDAMIYVTKGLPREPLFSAADVIAKVAPLPVAALHSTRDEFVPVDEIKRTMERAREPKRLWLIDAENHRFGGAEAELGRRLEEAVAWIGAQRQ